MSNYYNATPNHVVESLANLVAEHDKGRLSVVEADYPVVADTMEEIIDRNLDTRQLCILEWNCLGSFVELTLSFHESMLDKSFTLNPSGPDAIRPIQGTQPKQLSMALADALFELEDRFDIRQWDFNEVSAGSIASAGHLCDFEFKYDTSLMKSDLLRVLEESESEEDVREENGEGSVDPIPTFEEELQEAERLTAQERFEAESEMYGEVVY